MSGFRGIRNENGRPKGSQNKDLSQIRSSFQSLIENNLEQLQSDLDELKPFERIKIILELSKFIIPTMKAVEVTDTNNESDFKPITITFTKPNHNDN